MATNPEVHHPNQEQQPQEILTSKDILMNLVDMYGQPLAKQILDYIDDHPTLKRIIVMGVPGSGKTTIVEGLIHILKEKKMEVSLQPFDKLRKGFLHLLLYQGIIAENLSEIPDQNDFAQFLSIALLQSSGNESDLITITELPAVGKVERGQFILKEIAKEKDEDTIVIHMIGDERLYEFAMEVRRIANTCQNDYELKTELKKLGIHLPAPSISDLEKTEWCRHFGDMANRGQIQGIRDEYNDLADDAYAEIMSNFRNRALVAQEYIHIPQIDIENTSNVSLTDRIKINAFYANYLFFTVWRFPDNAKNVFVAVNQQMQGSLEISLATLTDQDELTLFDKE